MENKFGIYFGGKLEKTFYDGLDVEREREASKIIYVSGLNNGVSSVLTRWLLASWGKDSFDL